MKARITRTIVGVTALVVALLGLPLAVVVQRFYESRATVELQRSAAQAIAELTVPLRVDEIADAAGEPDSPRDFSVYDTDGRRLFGPGPSRVDARTDGEVVVVSPVTDRSTEMIVGSVRVSQSADVAAGEARRAWGLMAIAAAAGLLVAIAVARREAARLAAPISELADRAERLGSEVLDAPADPTGVPELDTLAEALAISSRRLSELVVREREFSANASHQLRTPLAGLRVSLEHGDTGAALTQADRLAETIDHMLALARNAMPVAACVDVAGIVLAGSTRWHQAFTAAGRDLIVDVADRLPSARVRSASLDQALDVLLDNALRHGAGPTRMTAHPTPGGVVIHVADDGPGIPVHRAPSVFERHEGHGSGIGLDLARNLIEADGGRLLLADPDHAEFRIVLVAGSGD